MKYIILVLSLLALSCGEDSNRCFDCTLDITIVEVCESTYKEQAERDNIEVGSLDEYIGLVQRTGFTCIERP